MFRPGILGHPAVRWVGPFAVFVALLPLVPALGLGPRTSLSLWVAVVGGAVFWLSRDVVEFRPSRPLWSVLVGVGVFLVWIAPDALFPGWRAHWLFQNAITGRVESTLPAGALADPYSLALRILRAVILVPIVEELFWRGWLMRWLIKKDFEKVPLGAYAAASFWPAAVLFALEHGPYWEVGFLAGAFYNCWMVRTKRVSDLILAHGVTNACLCAFVLATSRWEYWL